MALRVLEATIPSEDPEELRDVLRDVPAADVWTLPSDNSEGLLRILVDARNSEMVSDALAARFGSREGFRLVLIRVEGTLPPVDSRSRDTNGDGEAVTLGPDGMQRISREELYEDITDASGLTALYVTLVALSTVVAAVGLVRGDVAIVIGAMVIAPLLGPNIALSLASTLGDMDLLKRSLKAMGAGIIVAAVGSVLLGAVLTIDPASPEIARRTQAGIGDVVLALAAGTAGSLAFTSGVPAVVVGVMVSVALLPPLVVAGLLVGGGLPDSALGALVLALTNVTCLNLAAMATFLLQKVRPRTWWEADRAVRATRIAASAWIILLALLLGLILSGRVGAAEAATAVHATSSPTSLAV